MKKIVFSTLDDLGRQKALARPRPKEDQALKTKVRQIFAEIETEDLPALDRWATTLDGAPLDGVEITTKLLAKAKSALNKDDLSALELAAKNIEAFARAELPQDEDPRRSMSGLTLQRVYRPLISAGLYVPGGTAPLFSSLLMQALPAQVAGVPEITVVTPPYRGETALSGLHPMMIAAASLCDLDGLWLVGGAQAIAGLTFGTGPLVRADKLFGPGNAWVAEAKKYAASLPGGPAIDMPAGPSELMVIADETASPAVIAADLLSQAEHDRDAQVLLISPSETVLEAVIAELEVQLATLPRAEIARAALVNARLILADDLTEAAVIANLYAPEHLSVQVEDVEELLPLLACAGTIFAGPYSAETFGDYVNGPSHVLPTDGAARAFDGITVKSFLTSFVIQRANSGAAKTLAPAAARLARLEGLEAHARAADVRLTLSSR